MSDGLTATAHSQGNNTLGHGHDIWSAIKASPSLTSGCKMVRSFEPGLLQIKSSHSQNEMKQ